MAALQIFRSECTRQIRGLFAVRTLLVRQRLTFDGPLVVFVLFVLCSHCPGGVQDPRLHSRHGYRWHGRDPQPDRTVVISGDRIASITSSPPPEGARAIDGRGKFLIPGLCDMHVHLAGVTADPKWSKTTLLPLLIANGVTTVRDMGGDLDRVADLAEGNRGRNSDWSAHLLPGADVGRR